MTTLPTIRNYAVRAVKRRILGIKLWTPTVIIQADNSTEAVRLAIIRKAIPSGAETVATLTHLKP